MHVWGWLRGQGEAGSTMGSTCSGRANALHDTLTRDLVALYKKSKGMDFNSKIAHISRLWIHPPCPLSPKTSAFSPSQRSTQ